MIYNKRVTDELQAQKVFRLVDQWNVKTDRGQVLHLQIRITY